jgi:hypothetical protein
VYIETVYNSLRQALSVVSLLCFHQSSGNGFQRRRSVSFLFSNFPIVSVTTILGYFLHNYWFLKNVLD